MEVTLKVAGIHWWYRTRSHAAELTAGYYNTAGRDGYNAMIEICAKHGAGLTLTCVEMCDAQHPAEALCGPEGLLRQVPPMLANASHRRDNYVFRRTPTAGAVLCICTLHLHLHVHTLRGACCWHAHLGHACLDSWHQYECHGM